MPPDELENKRRQYRLEVLDHVRRHIERGDVEHLLVLTRARYGDVALHSAFCDEDRTLALLARAIHRINLAIDGDIPSGPLTEPDEAG